MEVKVYDYDRKQSEKIGKTTEGIGGIQKSKSMRLVNFR